MNDSIEEENFCNSLQTQQLGGSSSGIPYLATPTSLQKRENPFKINGNPLVKNKRNLLEIIRKENQHIGEDERKIIERPPVFQSLQKPLNQTEPGQPFNLPKIQANKGLRNNMQVSASITGQSKYNYKIPKNQYKLQQSQQQFSVRVEQNQVKKPSNLQDQDLPPRSDLNLSSEEAKQPDPCFKAECKFCKKPIPLEGLDSHELECENQTHTLNQVLQSQPQMPKLKLMPLNGGHEHEFAKCSTCPKLLKPFERSKHEKQCRKHEALRRIDLKTLQVLAGETIPQEEVKEVVKKSTRLVSAVPKINEEKIHWDSIRNDPAYESSRILSRLQEEKKEILQRPCNNKSQNQLGPHQLQIHNPSQPIEFQLDSSNEICDIEGYRRDQSINSSPRSIEESKWGGQTQPQLRLIEGTSANLEEELFLPSFDFDESEKQLFFNETNQAQLKGPNKLPKLNHQLFESHIENEDKFPSLDMLTHSERSRDFLVSSSRNEFSQIPSSSRIDHQNILEGSRGQFMQNKQLHLMPSPPQVRYPLTSQNELNLLMDYDEEDKDEEEEEEKEIFFDKDSGLFKGNFNPNNQEEKLNIGDDNFLITASEEHKEVFDFDAYRMSNDSFGRYFPPLMMEMDSNVNVLRENQDGDGSDGENINTGSSLMPTDVLQQPFRLRRMNAMRHPSQERFQIIVQPDSQNSSVDSPSMLRNINYPSMRRHSRRRSNFEPNDSLELYQNRRFGRPSNSNPRLRIPSLNRTNSDELDSSSSYNSMNDLGLMMSHPIQRARELGRGIRSGMNEYEHFVALDEHNANPVPEKFLKLLPVIQFTQANLENFSEDNKGCTICMENYQVGEQYMLLPCFHRFHEACVKQWLKSKNVCPNCKDKITAHFRDEDAGEPLHLENPSNNIARIRPHFVHIASPLLHQGSPSIQRIAHLHRRPEFLRPDIGIPYNEPFLFPQLLQSQSNPQNSPLINAASNSFRQNRLSDGLWPMQIHPIAEPVESEVNSNGENEMGDEQARRESRHSF